MAYLVARYVRLPACYYVSLQSNSLRLTLTISFVARAIETQCYVIAAAQYGRHNQKRESYGHSLAVDPWGRVIADAGGSDGPGTVHKQEPPSIIVCDIDLEELQSVRQRMPIQQHRDAASFSF